MNETRWQEMKRALLTLNLSKKELQYADALLEEARTLGFIEGFRDAKKWAIEAIRS